MYSYKYRPASFSELIGDELPKKVLSKISKDPDSSPRSIVLEGHWGTGKCVIGSTRVRTSLGYLPIRKLAYRVKEPSLADGIGFYTLEGVFVSETEQASKWYAHGVAKTIKISSSQFELTGTHEHPIKVLRDGSLEWVRLDQIKHGDWIAVCSDTFDLCENIPVMSAGPWIKKSDFCWVVGVYWCAHHIGNLNDEINPCIEPTLPEDMIHGYTDQLPSWVWSVNQECLRSFLGGYLDNYGSKLQLPVATGTFSQMRDLRDLFNLCGCFPILNEYKRLDGTSEHCLLWAEDDYIKYERFDLRTSKLDNFEFYARSYREQIPFFGPDERFPQIDGVEFIAVTSIEEGEEEEVFDLEVPESHSFIANGLISHNTTSSRIFSKAINCQSRTGDACNVCDSCLQLAQGSPLYVEVDCGTVGRMEAMKEFRDTFDRVPMNGYRVIAFDEAHLMSPQSQSLLLKTLEEDQPRLFFLWISTDSAKILPTIRSRSLILTYHLLSEKEVKDLLSRVAESEGLEVPDQVIKRIQRRCEGHARDALQLLQHSILLGYDEFMAINSLDPGDFYELFTLFISGEDFDRKLGQITSHPLPVVRQELRSFIKDLSYRLFVKEDSALPKAYQEIIPLVMKFNGFINHMDDVVSLFLLVKQALSPKKSASSEMKSRFSK